LLPVKSFAVVSHSSQKRLDPDCQHAAPPTAAYAAFIEESRMKIVNAKKLHRKFGGMGHPDWLLGRSLGRKSNFAHK
jgi:hypothetical protein